MNAYFVRHLLSMCMKCIYLLCNVYILKICAIFSFHHAWLWLSTFLTVYNSLRSEHSLQMCVWAAGDRAPKSLWIQTTVILNKVREDITHACIHVCQQRIFWISQGYSCHAFLVFALLLSGRDTEAGFGSTKSGIKGKKVLRDACTNSHNHLCEKVSSPLALMRQVRGKKPDFQIRLTKFSRHWKDVFPHRPNAHASS